ncbi:hypothetical protein ACJJIR_12565 [Microbulbifer sp. SSSA008]|uniref:hypothetical protein n=1 Tax=Microbulbifer sp. SSSA008 TaxID=3243380 RepID=UPI00403A2E7A
MSKSKLLLNELMIQNSLAEDKLNDLFSCLVKSLGDGVGVKLKFDVQDVLSEGVYRCNAYDVTPLLGELKVSVTANVIVNCTQSNPNISADVLLHSQGKILEVEGKKSYVTYICHADKGFEWKFESWKYDENGFYDDLREIDL